MTGPTRTITNIVLALCGRTAARILLHSVREMAEHGYIVDPLLSQAESAYVNVIGESIRPSVPKSSGILLSLPAALVR